MTAQVDGHDAPGDAPAAGEFEAEATGEVDREAAGEVLANAAAVVGADATVGPGGASVAAARRPSRRQLAALLATVVVVAVAGLFAAWYRDARGRLRDERAKLAAATQGVAETRAELDHTRHRAALTRDGTEVIRSEIELAAATRAWVDAVTRNTVLEIARVDADRAETDTARYLAAANSNEVHGCLDGVSRALAAHRDGDVQSSIAALGAAAGGCTRTLAFASGARFPYDFADPFVLPMGDGYYAYSTNAGAGDIQVIRSADLVDWELVGNGLAAVPGWATPNATWAPAVLPRNGGYVVYYTVRDATSHRQCISRAWAASPAGPFLDRSSRPLVCQAADGGSIDPSPFVDVDGRAYLLWKSEGSGAAPATIWSQQLTADGLALVGTPRPLVSADRPFERGVVEAPTLVREGRTYFLLYAAGDWNSRSYSIAHATCAGPLGPCAKPADGRVLASGPRLAGPGGAEVFRDREGALWVAFHAFTEPDVGYPSSRYLHIARMRIVDGRVVLDATT